MKKILLLSVIISSIIYAKNITLEGMLNDLSNTSYQNDIYKNKQINNKVKEKYYKLGTFNGVDTSASTEYSDREKKYQSSAKASFGPFFVEGTRDYDDSDYATFGAEKSIKDLIYSNNKSELKKLELNKKVDELSYKLDLESQKLALIALYVEYKSNEKEIKIKEAGIKSLNTERNKLQASYNLGGTAKIDVDSIDTSLSNMKLEIQVLKGTMERQIGIFYYNFGINATKDKLLDIQPKDVNIDDLIKEYGTKDIEKQTYEKKVTEENYKYLKYDDKMPDIAIGIERSTRNDENRVYLTFSKRFFGYNVDLENSKMDLDDKEITLNQAINENEGAKLKAYYTYESYLKDYMTNKNSANLEKRKYDIKLMEYSLGKSDYLDVMTSFNDYINYEVAMEKAKNKLYGYIYELMIRSEK